MAYILTASILVKKLLSIDLNIEGIADLLTNNEKESRDNTDIYDETLDFIKELINKNLSNIDLGYEGSDTFKRTKNTIGKRYFDKNTNHMVVALSKTFVDKEMANHGFNDRTKLLKVLADRGYIDRDDDHIAKKTIIGLVRQYAYRFIIRDIDLSDDCEKAMNPTVNTTRKIVDCGIISSNPAEELVLNYDDGQAIEEIFNEENKN